MTQRIQYSTKIYFHHFKQCEGPLHTTKELTQIKENSMHTEQEDDLRDKDTLGFLAETLKIPNFKYQHYFT